MQPFGTILRGSSLQLQVSKVVWNSFHLGGLEGDRQNNTSTLISQHLLSGWFQVLGIFAERLQIRSPHNCCVDSWAKVTLEIPGSGGRSCFIHSTEEKYKEKGERTDLCWKSCRLGCNLSLCELCLLEGLVTLWKSLPSGCYYCSQFPTKISLLSPPAMLPLAEKKQNLCVAARAAKLKVRAQRQIAASPGLWLDLTRGTGDAPTQATASDLWRQTPGEKPKRKHPSKMQTGEKKVSSSSLGLYRWKTWGFSFAFWDTDRGAISRIQKGTEKLSWKE